jgi:hypothetical protein
LSLVFGSNFSAQYGSVNADVEVRAEPSLDALVTATLAAGTRIAAANPVTLGGITWWIIVPFEPGVAPDPALAGYVQEQFLTFDPFPE